MSAVAFVTTKDVKHVAVWTAERDDPARGAYRPLCGGKVRHWSHSFYIGHEDEATTARVDRLPLCKPCAKVCAAIAEVVAS